MQKKGARSRLFLGFLEPLSKGLLDALPVSFALAAVPEGCAQRLAVLRNLHEKTAACAARIDDLRTTTSDAISFAFEGMFLAHRCAQGRVFG